MTSSGGAQPGSLVPPRDVTGASNTSLGINTVIRNPHDNGGVTCHVDTVYEPTTAAVCAVYIVIGLLYTFIGYRCFKTTMFLTGFIFASSLVYLICLQGELLPPYGNAGVALFAGLLFGLITMLVQYVGLFMGGLHTGLLLAVAGLLAADHVSITTISNTSPSQQQQRGSVWLCVGVLLASALCFASLNLYFRRALTVVGSVVYGAAMVMVACDYYVEHLASLSWLWERVSLRPPVAPPCWYSWLVLAVWPSLTLLGLPVQCLLTGRGLHHDDDVAAGRKKPSCRPGGGGGGGGHHGGGKGTAAIVGGGGGSSDRAQLRQNKYRYLYQVRTAHGDVISQNYVQALQRGGGGGGNLATTTTGGGGSVLSEEGAGECSTLQSDATHLTILPDHQLPILTESEDDSSSVSSLSEMTPSTVTASVVAASNATVNLTASNAVMQQRTQQYHHHHHHNNNIRYS